MRDVSIIGVGDTVFGELWDKSFRDLAITAGLEAFNDCNLTAKEIDALYVGNMSAGSLIQQEHVGALIADHSGLARGVPTGALARRWRAGPDGQGARRRCAPTGGSDR